MSKDNIKEFSETKMIGIGILWDRPMLDGTYSRQYIKYLEIEDNKKNRLFISEQLDMIKVTLESNSYLALEDKIIQTADVLIVDKFRSIRSEVREEE